jgi:hypothetical protein
MWYSLFQPGFMVTVAGFQNIEDSPPEPDAAPAKERPWAVALCSRIPKAPACAAEFAAAKASIETAANASARFLEFITILPRKSAHPGAAAPV